MPRLRHVDCSAPGITRRRRGRGFSYFDEHGRKVTDPELLQRIRDLAVPPAWEQVWVCPHPNGHLQAVGVDAAGPAGDRRRGRARRGGAAAAAPRGGPELLAYKSRGRWRHLDARDVNAFVKDEAGEAFTAKDFRTWNATVLAAVAVAVAGWTDTKTGRKRAVSHATREVAHYLGNTPTVARNSYIDPRVFDRYRSGWTIAGVLEELAAPDAGTGVQGPVEQAVVDLLTEHTDSDAVIRGPALEP